jgi:hypothetical protein
MLLVCIYLLATITLVLTLCFRALRVRASVLSLNQRHFQFPRLQDKSMMVFYAWGYYLSPFEMLYPFPAPQHKSRPHPSLTAEAQHIESTPSKRPRRRRVCSRVSNWS